MPIIIPIELLRKLLELCTREAPFKSPDGKLYVQIEGVAMGSPLGPTFANFYMGELERSVFENVAKKPLIYVRYVDDIFVLVNCEDELVYLKRVFQENSVLNFTYELGVNGKLPFLDVQVDKSSTSFRTSVYHKPTDQGKCLNYKSECPDRYKLSVINNYLNRAYKVSSSWENFHNEILHVKQVLVNNNYPNSLVDMQIKKYLGKKVNNENSSQGKSVVPIYYEAQMHDNYKLEERIIKNLIYDNTKCLQPDSRLNLIIYYKNQRTSHLVMKNNMSPRPTLLQQSNVVYKFSCPLPHSQAVEYVGMTQTTLSRRLTCHAQDGGICKHFVNHHLTKPTREQLTENTTVIARSSDRFKLCIKEALYIMKLGPLINKQYDNFSNILKLYDHRNYSARSSNGVVPTTSHNLTTPNLPNLTTPNPTHLIYLSSSPPSQPNLTLSDAYHLSDDSENLNHNNLTCVSQPTSTIYPVNPHAEQLHCLDPNDDDVLSLPDMNIVLRHFGIEPSNLKPVPLENYTWENSCESPGPPTISQRIRTLVRDARHKKNYK